VFDLDAHSDYVLISLGEQEAQLIADKTLADYRVDDLNHFLYVWENTYNPAAPMGVNSFGRDEEYPALTVGSMGWSGLGFASTGGAGNGKDLSMLDNSYKLHIAFKGNDVQHEEVKVFIAGGGIAGSGLFRYFSEAGLKPVMVNWSRGASWRNIGGGRPAFSNPDIADIAQHSHEIFKTIQKVHNINYKPTHYVNLVHDEATYKALDASRAWSDAYMIDRKDFKKEISPLWDDTRDTYSHALITRDCWQATPGRVIDYIRGIGVSLGGRYYEDTELLSVWRKGDKVVALVRNHEGKYVEYTCGHFVNAMGWGAEKFTDMLGIDTGLYPVKHQAFITRRLPMMGPNGGPLDMIIDRRHYKGFSAVYGQQFEHTGQIIGCASPDTDAYEARQNIKYNSKEFLEIVSEVFAEWIPNLREVGFLAVWAGRYTEPRYIVDPNVGLCTGLRGHGFMLGQYLAKLYVDKYLGREVPSYMNDLAITGKGLSENAFK
jgi:glycine/D-amino acid oxidase-like deaminating enzyme